MQYTCNESEDVTENLPRYVTELNDFSCIKTSYVRFFITLMGISYVFVALSLGKLGIRDETGYDCASSVCGLDCSFYWSNTLIRLHVLCYLCNKQMPKTAHVQTSPILLLPKE